ncbi:MAG: S9 family peptidase [Planctomycetota bacterium]|nr:S9 family peptidase [Planctomycetota bacterium]
MTVADPVRSMQTIHEAVSGSKSMTAEVLWSIPRVGGPAVSPDQPVVAVPVTTYAEEDGKATTRIWLVETQSGDARPITTDEASSTSPVFSPGGSRLAFLRPKSLEEGKDPVSQIWILPLEGGEAVCVTEMPLGCLKPIWMPDGDGLIFAAWLHRDHLTVEGTREAMEDAKPSRIHVTEDRFYRFWDRWLTDARIPHIFHLDLESGALTDLTPDSTLSFDLMDPGSEYDIAPDGSWVVFAGSDLSDDSRGYIRWDVFRVPIEGGTPECLTPDNPAHSARPRFSPDGAGIVYGRSEDPEYYADRMRLWWIDTEDGAHSPVLTEWDRNPGGWTFNATGDLYFHADDVGRYRLYVLPASDLLPGTDDEPETEPTALTSQANAMSAAPAADGHVFFSRMSLSEPPEVWRAGIRGGEPVRLTFFTQEVMEDVALGEVRDLRYAGADDHEIQSFVLLPPGYEEGTRYPVLHMVHGGPHGILGDYWHWRWHAQTVAAQGYVVAVPQFHGSTSYGTDFAKVIQGALGEKPLEDTMKGVDALIELGIADEAKMAIGGGSYGGFLTCWATTQTDRFACAINHAGVFDSQLQWGCDYTYGMHRQQGSTPFEDQSVIDANDAGRHTKGMNTPMLVLHGERDFRVPYYHAIECYNLLKAKGVPARLVFFQDENHWVLKRDNSLLWYDEVMTWMDRWLKSE